MRAGALVCPVTVHTTASIEARFGVTLIDIILTVAAGKSRQTQAGEGIDSIHTGATIEARAVSAVVGVDLTVDATEARRTGARVAVDTISAVGPIPTGVTLTLVYVLLTPATTKPGQTGTRETVDTIAAQTTVTAGIWFAVISVCLTLLASVAWLALALVASHSVMANGAIAAWALHTFIDINLTRLTLPSFRADAGEALVVFRLLAYSTVFTGSSTAGGQQGLTVFTSVGQQTVALVSGYIIDAGALVEAGVGGTLIDVSLAVRSCEADSACTVVSAGHVLAGSPIHAWVGLALVIVDVTIWAAPAGVTGTFVAIDEVLATAMDTGIAATLIHLRQTGGVIVALWAEAGEAVDAVNACTPVVTGVNGTLIDVDVTHCSCVAWLTCTLVAIDFVDAPPVVAGFALTVIQVHLTIETCSAFGAGTDICVLPVLASATVLAGLA